MTDFMYYFDTLPVHPPPERLESLTSYLTRLAEANNISSIWELGLMAFPGASIAIIRNFKDHPPLALEHFQMLSRCSKQQILQTTFYHLGKKFDRSEQQSLIRFLIGSIADYLRYCPYCLKEAGYYPLTWRFIDIKGCYKHKCQLLNVCDHCQSVIPLFTQPLRMHICSHCGKDLRQCRSLQLTDEEDQKTLLLTKEIEILLVPQAFEGTVSPIKELLGKEFVALRQKRNIKRKLVGQHTDINHSSLIAIEFGNESSTSFRAYFKYAQYLETNLSEIFTCILHRISLDQSINIYVEKKNSEAEAVLVAVQRAIDILVSKEEPITIKKISKMTFISKSTLRIHKSASELINKTREYYEKSRRVTDEQSLLDMAKKAVSYLNERREPITYETIGRIIGLHKNAFSRYPSVKEFVRKNYIYYYQRQGEIQTQEKIVEVNKAIKKLEERKEEVTFLAVSKIVDTTIWSLRTNASTRSIILSSSKKQEEEDVLPKVIDAIKSLEDAGIKVTTITICQSIPIHRDRLRSNRQAWDVVTQKTCESRLSKGNHQKQEEILIVKVNNAIQEITAGGEEVTQARVCEVMCITRQSLRKYSNANAIIRQFVGVQKRQKKEELFIKVKAAVQYLIEKGELLIYQAIGEMVNVIPGSLFYHREVAAFLKKTMNEQRQFLRLQQHIKQEEEIVLKIHEEAMKLQQLGKRVSITAIIRNLPISSTMLKHYPKAREVLATFNYSKNQFR